MTRLYVIVGLGLMVVTLVAWVRLDAVSDYRDKLDAERITHIEDAREIEHETGSFSDDALIDSLRGRVC